VRFGQLGGVELLPKELLDVRRYRGKVFPKFAGKKDFELAERVIRIFKAGSGKKYGVLKKALKSIEDAKNFKKVRGFSKILEDRFLERRSKIDVEPLKVREFLFERGYVTSRSERERVIGYAARYFKTDVEKIERAIYADLDEEQVVELEGDVSPEELVRLYNLSLLQTSLFNSLRLTFWTSSNHKEIFRAIKRLGLIYELYYEGEKIVVDVMGTASILKLTRKYGTSIAKLVPYILKAREWKIRAEILEGSRIYTLEIDNKYSNLFPVVEERIDYDSSLEEEFCRKLRSLGYEVVREPGLLKAGRHAFIPDFIVRRGGSEVYVEIVGFWTEEYLKRKLEKIRKLNVPLLVVAREEFGEGKVDGLITFSKRIPYNLVLREIRKFIGTTEPRKREYDSKLIERLKEEIEKIGPKYLEELRPILEKYDIDEFVLEKLGYRVVWKSLDRAEIEKI